MKLVIADDDPIQRRLVAAKLGVLGHQVTAAADGEEALELIRRIRPDAVVSDVMMPKLDGFEMCRTARKDPDIASIPILLVTNSYVEAGDRQLALRSGARDLILRTPDLAAVTAALDALQTTK